MLLANAVIFANGGAHLEFGEHYLTNEYFPNDNLQIKGTTKDKLIGYYDFMVAYQNLLRDGGRFAEPEIAIINPGILVTNESVRRGHITAYGRQFADKDVVHLVNFIHANTMAWNDALGTQAEPTQLTEIQIRITVERPCKKMWLASPDSNAGAPQIIPIQQQGNKLTVTIPSLKYWDMLVIEYE